MGIRKKQPNEKTMPKVTKELEGLNISINTLGTIQSSFDIDKINAFLDQHVWDPKIEEANRAGKKEPE
jgi:hypothetical protein